MDLTYGGLMTPNTQTILQQFFSLSPTGEETIEFPQQTFGASTQLSVYSREQPAMQAWDPANTLIPAIPYEPTFMLPTGLNLLRPSTLPNYADPADLQRFLPGMDEQSIAYHFGLPLNLNKQELQISGSEDSTESIQAPFTEDSALSLPPFDSSSWLPKAEPAKKPKDPIDVPPFLRDKLLNSYFKNLKRCPSCYVDRDQLYRRLEGENRPHPSWLFSMVRCPTCPCVGYSFLHCSTFTVFFGYKTPR